MAERRAGPKGRAAPAAGHFIEPMACLAVASLPAGPAWEYEPKFDAYRASRQDESLDIWGKVVH